MTYTRFDSPLGSCTIVNDKTKLIGFYFDETPKALLDGCTLDPKNPTLINAQAQLKEYFEGTRQEFDLPLDLRGTPQQQSVWQALQNIPYGQTTTYGEIAQAIGRPTAVRAVASAIGQNPLCVIVPCHRVIGRNGKLSGYAGGLERKKRLLQLEGASGITE